MSRHAIFIFLFALLSTASAQLEVSLELKRAMFIRGEPVEATVVIRNLAGKDVMLTDSDSDRWFGFEIMKGEGNLIAPLSGEYKNAPQVLLSGGTMRRTVDLVRLYPVNEYGTYTVRAAIYFQETGKYIASAPVKLDISEGRKLWSQTVGVPAAKDNAGEYHVVSLLTFPHPKQMMLYARIVDEKTGTIFATYPLGRFLNGADLGHEFDRDNTLHVLHMIGPSQYYLSKIGVNGEWYSQTMWESARGRPSVRKKEDGRMVIVGATRSAEKLPPGPEVPRLSDRPVTLPK
ncbi:MAG: hypothetical protein NTV08_06340 [Verrucomicrobia bacterium]|nr:hypothetical protein [Verrucomicrobiota bacterium]